MLSGATGDEALAPNDKITLKFKERERTSANASFFSYNDLGDKDRAWEAPMIAIDRDEKENAPAFLDDLEYSVKSVEFEIRKECYRRENPSVETIPADKLAEMATESAFCQENDAAVHERRLATYVRLMAMVCNGLPAELSTEKHRLTLPLWTTDGSLNFLWFFVFYLDDPATPPSVCRGC